MAHLAVFSTRERKLEQLRNCGRATRSWSQAKLIDAEFGTHFGLNFRLSSILAAIGLRQIERLADRVDLRRRTAFRLKLASGQGRATQVKTDRAKTSARGQWRANCLKTSY